MPPRQVPSSAGFVLRTEEVAGLPIVNRFLDRLKLSAHLSKHIGRADPRAKLAAVEALGVLVRNLVLSRVPLYSQGEWAQRISPQLLGLSQEQLALVNDDRIGRGLDRLFDADRAALLTDFVVHMVKEFAIEVEQFHNDSTTITLHGEYAEADGRTVRGKPTVVATQGHNKDHRPDLKQLLWILTVSADGAVPVHFKVTDGNTEDSTTHIETWNLLRRLVGKPDFLYVADCKLCTRENLRYIADEGGSFITILPKTRGEDTLFRDWLQSNTPRWQEFELKPGSLVREDETEIVKAIESPVPDADGFRLIWVSSSLKRQRDFLARKGRIDRAFKDLDDFAKKLEGPRCRYTTKGSVATAADAIFANSGAARWIAYDLKESVKETFRQETRGRSGKNTRWKRSVKPCFHLTVTARQDNIEYDTRCDGIFPLITNRKDLALSQIVEAYKCKQPLIETRHHLLKNVQSAAPALLKSPSRIEALLFVHYIALTVHALIEREVRAAMVTRDIAVLPLYPERRRCAAPTTERILEVFGNLQRHYLSTDNGHAIQKFEPELTPLQLRLLQLLRIPPRAFEAR